MKLYIEIDELHHTKNQNQIDDEHRKREIIDAINFDEKRIKVFDDQIYKLRRLINAKPIVKDLLPNNESEYYDKIRKLEDALHDKKAEICKLREKIALLEETIGGYQS